ncbi:MAG: PAS domain-containing protein [Bacteroidales bacterium]|nr:PAS domain-containing protein [Bacteroidales bacterium]
MIKVMFDYFENAVFSVTVCDKDGVVLYQNAVARERDGDVVGKNLYGCHGKKSAEMIRHMMETGASNTYEVVRDGKRRLIHHTPWFEKPADTVAGLVEIAMDLPDNYMVIKK